MYKLLATILKDVRILLRDKVGLTLMFLMPVVLAIVISAVQNSTFELVNDNKVALMISNKDRGEAGKQLIQAIDKIGMFELQEVGANLSHQQVADRMHDKDALVALLIPADFTSKLQARAKDVSSRALNDFGVTDSLQREGAAVEPISMFYHPVLQLSFRQSIEGALRSALQIVETKQVVRNLYFSLNDKQMPDSLEQEIITNQVPIKEIAVSRDGSRQLPNATQHNVPAWTIFAMFFVVISLGSSVVREKRTGSFIRLKTLPTNYLVSLFSKQLTYLFVTLLQTVVIFSIGAWLFPSMGLPALNLPADLAGLFIVTVICGWCAVSYAICIGVFAETEEQANGFGAVSIVLLAAVGGLLVPSFAMPASFQFVMKMSPLHWCLEAFYGLFLEGGKLKDVVTNILPLLLITGLIQLLTLWGLKRKKLI